MPSAVTTSGWLPGGAGTIGLNAEGGDALLAEGAGDMFVLEQEAIGLVRRSVSTSTGSYSASTSSVRDGSATWQA